MVEGEWRKTGSGDGLGVEKEWGRVSEGKGGEDGGEEGSRKRIGVGWGLWGTENENQTGERDENN